MPVQTYCSACGARLPTTPPVTCPACQTSHWRNQKPCASALITHNRRLLLVRRNHDPWIGHWDIPGGFCGWDEHPITTAEREAHEETGLVVRVTGLLGMWVDVYDRKVELGAQETTLNIYYHAVPVGDVATKTDPAEVAEIRWFPPEKLPEEIAFPDHIVRVFKAWRQAFLSGQTTAPIFERQS